MTRIPNLGRVTSRELGSDSETWFVSVEWVDEEGYRVSGMFKQFGWNAPPGAVGEKLQATLNRPPIATYGRRRSAQGR
jgi:hypothetical protein